MKTLNIAVTGLKGSGKTSVVKKLQQKVELETEYMQVYSYKQGDTLVYLTDTVYDIEKIKPTLLTLNQADACLICVSAIDGVSQAFGELVLLLNFANVTNGVVAITKTDSADADQIASLKAKIKAVFSQTSLKNISIVETSTFTDQGFIELKEELTKLEPKQREKEGQFKMIIDSAKEVKSGFTAVTGVIERGSVKKYDKVIFMPWGKDFIVQEIQKSGEIFESASAGERCSLSFKGLYPWDVQPGDIVVTGDLIKKGKVVELLFEVTPFFKDELRPETEVELNIGAQTYNVVVKTIKKDGAEVQKLGSGEKANIVVESKLPIAFEEKQRCIIINPQAHWRSIKVVGSGTVVGCVL